jgi:murein DD-endopeptidase MepM/ murein hydrolase activator NlpD
MALKIFPVAASGNPKYSDDFGAPRSNGRTHQGNDIFAPVGTPVLMPDNGTVVYYTDGIGGPSFIARFDDKSRAYGTHLSEYAFDLPIDADTRPSPRRALAGEIIGKVGKGGNASGTPPHLHFQYWLPDGSLVDPFPYLNAAQRVSAPSTEKTSLFWPVVIVSGVLVSGYFLLQQATVRRALHLPVKR